MDRQIEKGRCWQGKKQKDTHTYISGSQHWSEAAPGDTRPDGATPLTETERHQGNNRHARRVESDGREVATHGQCCGTEEKSAQSAPSVVSTGVGRSAGWLVCLSKRAGGLENEPTRTLAHTRPDARRDRRRLIPPLGGWPCLARFQGKRQRALVYVPRPLCVSVSAPVCVCVCMRAYVSMARDGRAPVG